MLSRGLNFGRSRLVAFFALLLVVAWLPMTSHELLEVAGWIHQERPDADHEDHGPAHDAADGLVRLLDSDAPLKAPTFVWLGLIVAFVVTVSLSHLLMVCRAVSRLRRTTESPPGLARIWQFVLRMALPGRAPSFAA